MGVILMDGCTHTLFACLCLSFGKMVMHVVYYCLYEVTCTLCEIPVIDELRACMCVHDCMFRCFRNGKGRFKLLMVSDSLVE